MTSISNGFRQPIGNGTHTEANDGDGYYVALDFNEFNPSIGSGSYHLGVDWNGEGGGNTDLGDPVYSVSNGQVTQSGFLASLGNYVVIRHDLPSPITVNGITTSEIVSLYSHLQFPSSLAVNDIVSIGQQIGQIGLSGDAGSYAHLHFEIRLGTQFIDPDGYNPAGAPNGWVDPTDFIDAHRTLSPSNPDLTVSIDSTTNTSIAPGTNLDVEYTLSNIGDAQASASFTEITLWDNPSRTGSVISVTLGDDSALGSSNSSAESASLSIPSSLTPGTYYVFARAGHQGGGESAADTANNWSSAYTVTIAGGGQGPADLTVTDVRLDDSTITQGQQTTIRYTVNNQGNTDAPSSVSGIYISTDSTFDGSDTRIDTNSVVVDSGEADSESESLEALSAYAPGTYWLFVAADINDDIDEYLNENNNVSAGVMLTIEPDSPNPQEDLIVASASLNANTINEGESTSISFSIGNIGDGNAPNSGTVGFWLSTDQTFGNGDDTLIDSRPYGEVSANSTGPVQSEVLEYLSDLSSGNYYIFAEADYENSRSESNEQNNVSAALQLTIEDSPNPDPLPDLTYSSIGWNDNELALGQVPDVQFTVQNDADVSTGAFSARLYLSIDDTVGPDDFLVTDHRISGLAAREETAPIIGENPVPTGFQNGDYYYLLTVDPDAEIAEADESNNVFYSGGGFWNPITIGSDTLFGTSGNDVLEGTSQDDHLYGFAGNDTLDGGTGADTLIGGTGNDKYHVDNAGDRVIEAPNEGYDIVYATTASHTLAANVERLIFDDTGHHTGRGNALDNILNGNAGNDKFVIDAGGADTFSGGGGEDSFDGRSSTVKLTLRLDDQTKNANALAGDMFVSIEKFFGSNLVGDYMKAAANGAAKFYGFGGNDALVGGGKSDILDGGEGHDTLSGGDGHDTLLGRGGNDRFLFDGNGSDTYSGGDGEDTFDGRASTTGLMLRLDKQALNGGGVAGDTFHFVEKFFGSDSAADTMYAHPTLTAKFYGFGGHDDLMGGNRKDYLDGGDGNDMLEGYGGNDTLRGGAGNDDLKGGTGADAMSGGLGKDEYWVDDQGDQVMEAANEGYDIVYASTASHTLSANVERLIFTDTGNHVGRGNALSNTLNGNAGNDKFVIDAGGADTYSGGGGSDTFDARSSAQGIRLYLHDQSLNGGATAGDIMASIETFLGANAAGTIAQGIGDIMKAGAGRAKFAGYDGDDRLTGGNRSDYLDGGAGGDELRGGGDNDILIGGLGNDWMHGGSGMDQFRFVNQAFGQDTIADYQDGVDTLKFYSAVADELSDFTISGNGTSTVTMTLVAAPTNTITINGSGGSNVTITDADILFY